MSQELGRGGSQRPPTEEWAKTGTGTPWAPRGVKHGTCSSAGGPGLRHTAGRGSERNAAALPSDGECKEKRHLTLLTKQKQTLRLTG